MNFQLVSNYPTGIRRKRLLMLQESV